MTFMVFSLLLLTASLAGIATKSYNLKLVTVLFRHGDRTPDTRSHLYPLDPHLNETYYPIGRGQLTNKGKQRMFKLGQLLRERYELFLGRMYYPGLVEAISTNIDRTKSSLQLVLAGAFPPKDQFLEWNPDVNWQPIPFNYTSLEHDRWMTPYLEFFCPKYRKLYAENLETPKVRKFVENYSNVYDYLRNNTGSLINAIGEVQGIYNLLLSQTEWGLKLPQWTEVLFPIPLQQMTVEVTRMQVATTELKQLSGGPMLKKIINNMIAQLEKKSFPTGRKLVLYSGHDHNIVYLSGVFDQNINQPIPYGSSYIVELIEIEGEPYVKIFTNDGVSQNITAVHIPGCQKMCPLNRFVGLLQKYIPDDDFC